MAKRQKDLQNRKNTRQKRAHNSRNINSQRGSGPVSYNSIAPLRSRPRRHFTGTIRFRRIFTGKISPGETFYTNLHELIIRPPYEKSAYPITNHLPSLKYLALSKTLLVTEVGRSSQWKILSPVLMSRFLLRPKVKVLMAHFKFSGDC